MMVVIATVAFFALVMGGMAVGVVMTGRPLKGSCGGAGPSCACEAAGTPGACAKKPMLVDATTPASVPVPALSGAVVRLRVD